MNIFPYRGGVQITPSSLTARIEREPNGRLVSRGETVVTDKMMCALIDSGRR